jgi:hypothetical protein
MEGNQMVGVNFQNTPGHFVNDLPVFRGVQRTVTTQHPNNVPMVLITVTNPFAIGVCVFWGENNRADTPELVVFIAPCRE